MKILGLDIGTNSVGSAWVDTNKPQIKMGVSVFPAGVEESEDKRGAPKNQARRNKRSSRRSLRRRSQRKQSLRNLLMKAGLLPYDTDELRKIFGPLRKEEKFNLEKWDPWRLRRKGLQEKLTPYEFGRILIHLNQHRGALGFDAKAGDEGKVKKAIDDVRVELMKRYAIPEEKEKFLTKHNSKDKDMQEQSIIEFAKWIEQNDISFGRMLADLRDERRIPVKDKNDKPKINKSGEQKYYHQQPIRNRRDSFEFHADRALIRNEFYKLWDKQKTLGGELPKLLTDDLLKELDSPAEDEIWQRKGEIFGQRHTYWRIGTLGRCDLEPTDRCIFITDMYAQEFRVLDYVNNLRIREGTSSPRFLEAHERSAIIELLREPQYNKKNKIKKSFDIDDLKGKIHIDKKSLEKKGMPTDYITFTTNEDEVICDWFFRDIACGVFGKENWLRMDEKKQDSVNHAILKFDTDKEDHEKQLCKGAKNWWKLSKENVEKLIAAWKSRPKPDDRLNLSRRAIQNLLPIMRNPISSSGKEYPNQMQACKMWAHDMNKTLSVEQRVRYAPKLTKEFKESLVSHYGDIAVTKAICQCGFNKKARHYLKKHTDKLLPPAPMLSNPVVRKAIHEVRHHILAHLKTQLKENGEIVLPDRVVIELVREGRQSAKIRDAIHAKNKVRRDIRKKIIEDHSLDKLTRNQRERAIERVFLCRQQNFVCPYTFLSVNDRNKQGFPVDGECVYTGKTITERQAASGIDVEVDHIVPYSRCGDDSINNKVLCYREENKNKGNQTPKEWLGENSAKFGAMEQRLRYLDIKDKKDGGPPKEDYFTKKDYKRKWENLHRVPTSDEFRNSQLSDTAYAAKQVGDYLRSALFDGESDGKQRVFFTNGKLTARLRRDWILYREIPENINRDDPQAKEKDELNYAKLVKDRSDHRHHAIDAVAIAFTPDYINEIAQEENYREDYYQRTGQPIKRKRLELPNPWASIENFRRSILSELYDTFDDWGKDSLSQKGNAIEFIVSHRPEKRRLIGGLHKETPYGKTSDPNVYVAREKLTELVKKDSASWVENIIDDGMKQIVKSRLKEKGIDVVKGIDAVKTKPKRGRPSIKFVDIKTGNAAKKSDVKLALQDLRMPKPNEVPIRSIRIKNPMSEENTVPIKGCDGVVRFYDSGNNHHMEILQDIKTGKWSGELVNMKKAAERNIERLRKIKEAGVPFTREMRKLKRTEPERYKQLREKYRPIISQINRSNAIVNRNDRNGKIFIMSLCIGEMLYMQNPKTKKPGYFVVFQTDEDNIGFTPHWDARQAKGGKVENPRDEFGRPPSKLKDLGTSKEEPPYKVWISPLGEIKKLIRD